MFKDFIIIAALYQINISSKNNILALEIKIINLVLTLHFNALL